MVARGEMFLLLAALLLSRVGPEKLGELRGAAGRIRWWGKGVEVLGRSLCRLSAAPSDAGAVEGESPRLQGLPLAPEAQRGVALFVLSLSQGPEPAGCFPVPTGTGAGVCGPCGDVSDSSSSLCRANLGRALGGCAQSPRPPLRASP